MKKAFTLIEILSAILIMGTVMVISIQSVQYVNSIHQQNEIRYLALNRIDSEMSRLVMAYENYTYSDFVNNSSSNIYKSSTPAEINNKYGLLISNGKNFVQLKNIGSNNNIVENGDFIAILSWEERNNGVSNNEVNLTLTLDYPYIYNGTSTPTPLWDYTELISLQTSTKVK